MTRTVGKNVRPEGLTSSPNSVHRFGEGWNLNYGCYSRDSETHDSDWM